MFAIRLREVSWVNGSVIHFEWRPRVCLVLSRAIRTQESLTSNECDQSINDTLAWRLSTAD